MTVADLARELATIPSHDDETAAGAAIESWLRSETDADVTRDDAGNVIARHGPDAPGESLALVGHHDVVPPDPSQVAEDGGYVVEDRDGRLHGRGTADMKGAVAAMCHAFRDADPAGKLLLASFVGEEVGGVGARHAIDDGFAPDVAIVAEGSTGYSAPGVTDVAVAHKGRREHEVTARGSSAHASEVGAGQNAIYRACEAIGRLRALEPPTAAVLGHRLEGSLAVTAIEGGTAANVIPDECTVTVDERTVPGRSADVGEAVAIEGVKAVLTQDLPPMACDDEAVAETVLEATAAAQDGEPALVVKPHATDAGWLAEAGTTCVVCGPAEPGEAHTADESVSIAVLERCAEVYRRVAETLPA